jgi:hypothetical protein
MRSKHGPVPPTRDSSTVGTPRGAAARGAHAGLPRQSFKLRPGRLPDAHLPRDHRLGYSAYKSLELYDAWLRGAELQADNTDYDSPDDMNDVASMCEADRVSWLLNHYFASHASEGMEPPGFGPKFDAREPAAGQTATLLAYVFDAPPTAGWLLSDIVAQQKELAEEWGSDLGGVEWGGDHLCSSSDPTPDDVDDLGELLDDNMSDGQDELDGLDMHCY